MQTTWDLLPFSFLVRPKASDSPEPGDNILFHLPTVCLRYLPATLDTLECWQKAAELRSRFEPMLTPHLKLLFFHQYCSQQLQEESKVSQDLVLMTHMKEDRTEACRNWVISWLEIFREVPALNYAVPRQLPSDLEGSTGDRSRCCSCSRHVCLSACTWVTPRKDVSIKKGGATQSSHRLVGW